MPQPLVNVVRLCSEGKISLLVVLLSEVKSNFEINAVVSKNSYK